MDGLSAAASVIAVIQISSQIFDLCRTYYLNVKEARQDIERLRTELTSLQDVLVKVVDFAESSDPGAFQTVTQINQDDGLVKDCQRELESLLVRLRRGESGKIRLALQSLKWPFASRDIDKILAAIERYKSSFSLALITDQAKLSMDINHNVAKIQHQLEFQKLDENKIAIIHWLSTTDPSVNYEAACRLYQPETGEWFLKGSDFQSWKSLPNSLLWINGIPGCGKTILSSSIIAELSKLSESNPKHAVAYFFFDFNSVEKQKVSSCLSSLAAQLLSRFTAKLPDSLNRTYQCCSFGKQQPNISTLYKILVDITENMDHVFIVLDALDECPKAGDRREVLKSIAELQRMTLPGLHLLVTSRRESDIETFLQPLLTIPAISLSGAMVNRDINLHISEQLESDPTLKKWPVEVRKEIEASLREGANGMFRWVSCQLDTLKRCLKVSLIRKALKTLPKTLDETYERLLLTIDEPYRQDAKNALLWLAFSERPLEIEELAEAIIVNPDSTPSFDPEDRYPDPQSVIQLFSSLITTVELPSASFVQDTGEYLIKTTSVTLAHFSVKEYLISDRIQHGLVHEFAISEELAQSFIAKSCLSYILDYVSQISESGLEASDSAKFPLLMYASMCWYEQLRLLSVQEQSKLNPLALKLLLSESALSTWLIIRGAPLVSSSGFGRVDKIQSGLVSFSGLGQIDEIQSPLFFASDLGLIAVVQELLAMGHMPQAEKPRAETPLHRAILHGHEEIIRLLINKSDVNAREHNDYTPLHYAALTSKMTTIPVKLLLERGANVTAINNYGWTSLDLAAMVGREDIVRMLIEGGASVNDRNIHTFQTALHWAAWMRHLSLLRYLISQGADVNAQNDEGATALHYAAKYAHRAVLEILIQNGASLNLQTKNGNTPLHWAADDEHMGLARELIDAGAETLKPLLDFAKIGPHTQFHRLLNIVCSNKRHVPERNQVLIEAKTRGYKLCHLCIAEIDSWVNLNSTLPALKDSDRSVKESDQLANKSQNLEFSK